ncbi:MAG: endonuclease domain-containing protein [Acidaminococcaceae bacterium]|nr:endonuclease domain-containing protein [Acidaminococcaceae bacterium]
MIRIYNSKLKQRTRQLRKEMTPWERHLWYDFLRNYSVKFYRQRTLGNFIVDFFCRQAMLVIELDGGGHYTPEQQQYDKERTAVLQGQGYQVIRFSNHDVDKNFYAVCTQIDEVVKARMKMYQELVGE